MIVRARQQRTHSADDNEPKIKSVHICGRCDRFSVVVVLSVCSFFVVLLCCCLSFPSFVHFEIMNKFRGFFCFHQSLIFGRPCRYRDACIVCGVDLCAVRLSWVCGSALCAHSWMPLGLVKFECLCVCAAHAMNTIMRYCVSHMRRLSTKRVFAIRFSADK